MDDKIKSVLDRVIRLCGQNSEFEIELRKALGTLPSANSVFIDKDVKAIREALEIRANKSISYDFIKEQRLRDQLIIDNLRMENAALNLVQNEQERFYQFCVNAFYQLENVINYYFHKTFPQIENLLECIEKYTESEVDERFQFKRSGKEKTVGDIAIVHKLNAVCNILLPNNNIKFILGVMRQVGNQAGHRCMVIQQEKNEDNYLYKFFKDNTFNTIRRYLIKITTEIQNNIGVIPQPKTESITAVITSLLPSACYIKYNDKTVQVPYKFYSRVRDKKVGDSVTVEMVNQIIKDVS